MLIRIRSAEFVREGDTSGCKERSTPFLHYLKTLTTRSEGRGDRTSII